MLDEHEVRRAEHDLVAVLEHVLGDALAATYVPFSEPRSRSRKRPSPPAEDLRVLLGDDAIEDLDRVVGMAADRVEGGELELLPLLAGGEDQLRHAVPVVDHRRRLRRHFILTTGRPVSKGKSLSSSLVGVPGATGSSLARVGRTSSGPSSVSLSGFSEPLPTSVSTTSPG